LRQAFRLIVSLVVFAAGVLSADSGREIPEGVRFAAAADRVFMGLSYPR
jgi:hypothetical protein